MVKQVIVSAAAFVSFAAGAVAQTCDGWSAVPAGSFPCRDGALAVWDSTHEKVVYWGGALEASPYTNMNDTWTWNGATWTQVATTGPAFRIYGNMAFDAGRGVTVLFGGTDVGPVPRSDTWQWDGTSWTQFTAGALPQARYGHAMAYDPAHNQIVVHGGYGPGNLDGPRRDTWVFDGAQWTQVSTTGPRMFLFADMFFDTNRNRIVLFGSGAEESETVASLKMWEWDGSSWSPITVTDGPWPASLGYGGRNYGDANSAAWDAARQRFVIHRHELFQQAETWEWDGEVFNRVGSFINTPNYHFYSASCFDGNLGQVMITGERQVGGPIDNTMWQLEGVPAWIDEQPAGGLVYAGSTLAARVHPGGTGPFTYQWRRDGVPLTNGGRVSGAQSRLLQITLAEEGDSGAFDVVVTNACGEAISDTVDLGVLTCPPDVNQDGILDFFDYLDFVADFESGAGRADYNQDDFIDFFDYDAFVTDFEAGC